MKKPEKQRRPRLLLLAWTFPPAATVGSVRTWNIASFLSRLGWDVTVVTPDPALIRVTEKSDNLESRLADEGIRRIRTGHRLRYLDPDYLTCWNEGLGWLAGGICRRLVRPLGISGGIGWIHAAERACADLRPEDVDVILASAPTFASFILASRLSRKL